MYGHIRTKKPLRMFQPKAEGGSGGTSYVVIIVFLQILTLGRFQTKPIHHFLNLWLKVSFVFMLAEFLPSSKTHNFCAITYCCVGQSPLPNPGAPVPPPGNNFQNYFQGGLTFAIFHVLRCRYLEIISRTPPPQISFKIHEIISRSFHLIILRGVPQVLSQPSPPPFQATSK